MIMNVVTNNSKVISDDRFKLVIKEDIRVDKNKELISTILGDYLIVDVMDKSLIKI